MLIVVAINRLSWSKLTTSCLLRIVYNGGNSGGRTHNLLLTRQLLFQLSYITRLVQMSTIPNNPTRLLPLYEGERLFPSFHTGARFSECSPCKLLRLPEGHFIERCQVICILTKASSWATSLRGVSRSEYWSPLLHFSRLASANRTSSPCLSYRRRSQGLIVFCTRPWYRAFVKEMP